MTSIELFSDAHPEYLDDDSDKVEVVKPDEEKITHEEEPASPTKADEIQSVVKQDWILKLGIFGFALVFIMWLVSRRRRSGYDALKQDEKSTV